MVDRPVLKSFQRLSRVKHLAKDGMPVGSWEHVPKGWEPAYRTMTKRMALAGIDCDGHPPMWAWVGSVTWGTAFGLIGHSDMASGYATLTFTPPPELVFYSDYEPWCDSLTTGDWPGLHAPQPSSDPGQHVVMQATVPRIEMSWVSAVTPLPTRDIYELDWDTPA